MVIKVKHLQEEQLLAIIVTILNYNKVNFIIKMLNKEEQYIYRNLKYQKLQHLKFLI